MKKMFVQNFRRYISRSTSDNCLRLLPDINGVFVSYTTKIMICCFLSPMHLHSTPEDLASLFCLAYAYDLTMQCVSSLRQKAMLDFGQVVRNCLMTSHLHDPV